MNGDHRPRPRHSASHFGSDAVRPSSIRAIQRWRTATTALNGTSAANAIIKLATEYKIANIDAFANVHDGVLAEMQTRAYIRRR